MRRILISLLLVAVVFLGGFFACHEGWFKQKQPELNVLIWGGYETLLAPFEKQHGVKVNYKTFFGGDAMFALFTQSRGVYDVVVVDPEYIRKLYDLGRLSPLDGAGLDTSSYFPYFKTFPLSSIDGKLYAPVVEFGSLGLVYNTAHITEAEAGSYAILFDPKVKGRVGVWDWYLPIMGVLSRSLGNEHPYDINDAQFDALKGRLSELRPQVRAIAGSFPELMTALGNEDTWIVPGGAEWSALALKRQGKPFDWTIPKEGGVMWVDTLVLPNDAPHPETAKLFIKWMMAPEAQAALSQKPAYSSYVPNEKAYELMPSEHRKLLKWTTAAEIEAMVAKLAVRTLPVQQTEKTWQSAWEAFKAGK
ncbi:spermidine/putrescine ABC transporter substrate-binding protein [Bradyrhizobium sp. UNPF46]|uniref:ABC transporter substrate-binding protein n=1 Tax=Bradyrhizobium sp. UNPF46 TaxID=1141168 RepID=UPI001154DF72|nr:spermidine/putrescine ABC transporter substrate-binding protein [Bradyrhizobium sp. UNPF46]